jgi:hypothetical protein
MDSNWFPPSYTLYHEMETFKKLMEENPDQGKEYLSIGETIVNTAQNGSMRKFCSIISSFSQSKAIPLLYFSVKAFSAALKSQHFMICTFLLDHGFPLNNPTATIPHFLNLLLQDEELSDIDLVSIIHFLHHCHFDLNQQENKTYWSPLHYAIQRGYLQCIETLLSYGIDVNSVAADDIMPLHIAYRLLQINRSMMITSNNNNNNNNKQHSSIKTESTSTASASSTIITPPEEIVAETDLTIATTPPTSTTEQSIQIAEQIVALLIKQ